MNIELSPSARAELEQLRDKIRDEIRPLEIQLSDGQEHLMLLRMATKGLAGLLIRAQDNTATLPKRKEAP